MLPILKGGQERRQNKGVVKENENRAVALRFIQNEVVDNLGQSRAVGELGDGSQRPGISEGGSGKTGKSEQCTWVKKKYFNLSTL